MPSHLDALAAHLADVHNLNAACWLLQWDQNTLMPPGGADARAAQLATLQRLRHERLTSDTTAELLEAAEGEVDTGDFASDAASLVRVARADYDYARVLPSRFVAEYARVTSAAFEAWKRAKAASDFSLFAPHLRRILNLKFQEAELRGYDGHIYDVFLGHWERGLTTQQVRTLFDAQRADLVELVAAVNAVQERVDDSMLHQTFPEDAQRALALRAAQAYGYGFGEWARLDVSPHPFCLQIAVDDIRLTTRYSPDFFNPAFFGVLHEAGHGLHGRGFDRALDGTFLSDMELCSMAVAESQSRTWENLVGRSRAFWEWFYPQARDAFPDQFGGTDAEGIYRAVNKARPQFLRVEADELTYNLHIMLRVDVELALVENDVTVDEVPDLWNDTFQSYFGMTPPDAARGVLQDIHWSMGGIGSFVGYALGNLLAVQFMNTALDDMPAIPAQIAQGEFESLRAWLTEHIYRHGRKFTADELARQVTGAGIGADDYVAYLRGKFSDLYGL